MILDGCGQAVGAGRAAGGGGVWMAGAGWVAGMDWSTASGTVQTMITPFDVYLLAMTEEVTRRTQRPARSVAVSVRVGISQRMTQHYLRRLEDKGAVCRPSGVKSGWVVTAGQMSI